MKAAGVPDWAQPSEKGNSPASRRLPSRTGVIDSGFPARLAAWELFQNRAERGQRAFVTVTQCGKRHARGIWGHTTIPKPPLVTFMVQVPCRHLS